MERAIIWLGSFCFSPSKLIGSHYNSLLNHDYICIVLALCVDIILKIQKKQNMLTLQELCPSFILLAVQMNLKYLFSPLAIPSSGVIVSSSFTNRLFVAYFVTQNLSWIASRYAWVYPYMVGKYSSLLVKKPVENPKLVLSSFCIWNSLEGSSISEFLCILGKLSGYYRPVL